jgi:alkanesulfonate monooxygenase SsuD/methylene tetrahydromethanopterin reductase-like flavin-dependent oxidoreductase (luciferase family)
MGWSPEEFEAAGAPMRGRGARANEALDVMHAIWTNETVEFSGKYYNVAKSIVLPNPVQKPHPPIYMAAYAPAAMKRLAEKADGWLPVGIPVPGMQAMWEQIGNMAKEAGRNPDDLKLIVRANVAVTPEPQGDARFIFVGSEDEVKADIRAVKEMGADEIEFDPTTGPWGTSVEGFLECAEKMREWAG